MDWIADNVVIPAIVAVAVVVVRYGAMALADAMDRAGRW